ncbi:MAG: transporter [Pelodictyon luteolum]|uniref:Permeases-like protein n=2 Tax=Pelodictyon luteolum TaxID=1100 RepID=Q3B5D8_CHLL3|nr:AEC family transporter [Pelodictyon luteolum]ABB23443.1 permeases-like protein [Pelodictyon luteolum DSM 273]KZK73803.1 MAG: transporter [Pelodictyon luteolum]
MFDLAFLLAPTFATFAIGILLRKLGVLDTVAIDSLFKIIYNLALPALLLSVLPFVSLEPGMLFLPLSAIIIIMLSAGGAAVSGRLLHLENKTEGVLFAGSIIMNLGFVVPFVKSFYGDEGLARLFVFDLPNSLSAYTIAYGFACRGNGAGSLAIARKIALSPPVWALMAGLFLNLASHRPGPIEAGIINSLSALAVPLLLLALGASARFAKVRMKDIIAGIGVRMVLGLAAGFLLADLFNLRGLDRAILIIAASAPAGFNTLTFAAIENLDRDYAASLVTTSMLLSLLLIPILLTIL